MNRLMNIQTPNCRSKKLLYILIVVFSVIGCSGSSAVNENDYLQSDIALLSAEQNPDDYVYSVFLIGDAGGASLNPRSEILQNLEIMLHDVDEKGAVVFVGDNLYPDGLPPDGSDEREELEVRLVAQLETVKNFSGDIIFMPGNHDWESSGEKGLEYINRQEKFIEEYLGRGNTFLPDAGMPGPVQVTLTQFDNEDENSSELNLIVMDTQWWLHQHKKPYPGELDTEEKVKEQAKAELGNLMRQNGENEVILGFHHPLESYGRHGGKFPVKTHIFPPVGGSLYAFYRKIWGYSQDVPHKNYSRMKSDILAAVDKHEGTILASGHEHSLQFIPFENDGNLFYQIVSGSATRLSYVRDKNGPIHTFRKYGFVVLRYYKDRSKRVEFYNSQGISLFEKVLPPQQSI